MSRVINHTYLNNGAEVPVWELMNRDLVPLAAFCRWVLQEYLLKESMSDEIERKIFEILESDKYDDVFFEKVTRAMSARRQK